MSKPFAEDGFRQLVSNREYYERLCEIATEALPEMILPELSQHDNDTLYQIGVLLNWLAVAEERSYTGDPMPPVPEARIAKPFLEMLGLIAPRMVNDP
jgi:hypothetical protein